MPPKKGGGGEPKKKKIVVDSTFGMKNKKGAKGQERVQQVRMSTEASLKQAKNAGMGPAERAAEEIRKAKAVMEKAAADFKALQRASIKQPPLEPGTDPKSVVCAFFKAGCCEKGAKCKYSHDLTMSRKTAKLDVYADRRSEEAEDKMEDWDQKKRVSPLLRLAHPASLTAGVPVALIPPLLPADSSRLWARSTAPRAAATWRDPPT